MRFPEWARNDKYTRLKFMCQIMSIHVHPDGSINQLARISGVKYETVLKAQAAGQMTFRVATALANASGGSGIKSLWLMAPDLLVLDEDGEVSE